VPLEFAGTLDRAVEIAAERARPGDTVLLAPACASFDQFDNFEHRGRVFRERVMALAVAAPGAAASKG
jgi:UDP-N-acetylmuramoylalanine--D-glutamate ligase